jgi:hypothetical protein
MRNLGLDQGGSYFPPEGRKDARARTHTRVSSLIVRVKDKSLLYTFSCAIEKSCNFLYI